MFDGNGTMQLVQFVCKIVCKMIGKYPSMYWSCNDETPWYPMNFLYSLVMRLIRVRIVPVQFVVDDILAGMCRSRPLQRDRCLTDIGCPKTTWLRWNA